MKTPYVCFVFILLFACSNGYSQSSIPVQFELGGGSNAEGILKIIPTSDGGVISLITTSSGETGSFASPAPTPTINAPTGWIILVKTNATGNIVWQKAFGGNDGNINHASECSDVIQTADGGWLIAGFSDILAGYGNKTAPNYGDYDAWAIKLDNNFNIVWQQSYGGTNEDKFKKVIELPGGNLLFAGVSMSSNSGTKTDTTNGFYDYWLVKTDENGNQLWDRNIGSSNSDFLYSSILVGNKVILEGQSFSDTASITPDADRSKSYGKYDYWIVALDTTNGNIIWDQTLGGPDDDLYPTICANSVSIFVAGCSRATNAVPPTTRTAPVKGVADAWLTKLDLNGNILWDKAYGADSTSGQLVSTIAIVPSTNELILGCVSDANAFGDKSENSRGGFDFWILKVDTNGNVIWDKTVGGSSDDGPKCITVIDAYNYYIGGFSESGISADKTCANYGGNDAWVIKFNAGTLGLEEAKETNFYIYPNPTSDKIIIRGDAVKQINKVLVTSLSGNVVMTKTITDSNMNALPLALNDIETGVYFIQVIGKDFSQTYKVIKE